ncbi:hypothetical protein BYT27DRAFT_7214777 [Phlegmacium glaucopus]|nr:hypothetical protein BYT27DRAFT_7214777 [Phlegmacium glaucopus]
MSDEDLSQIPEVLVQDGTTQELLDMVEGCLEVFDEDLSQIPLEVLLVVDGTTSLEGYKIGAAEFELQGQEVEKAWAHLEFYFQVPNFPDGGWEGVFLGGEEMDEVIGAYFSKECKVETSWVQFAVLRRLDLFQYDGMVVRKQVCLEFINVNLLYKLLVKQLKESETYETNTFNQTPVERVCPALWNVSISGGSFVNITREKGIDVLRKHIAPGAFHNSAERYDPPKCHPQTRVAVIQAIVDWIKDGQKTSCIKWLYGPAGAGKSAIAQEIAELYHKSGHLAASFFWSRNVAGRNNEERLVASLAYQLLIAIPQIRGYIKEVLENDPSLLSRSLAAQIQSLVVEPLMKVFDHDQQRPADSELPKLIILDGLNEYEKYRPDDDIRLFLVESFESVKRSHALRSCLPCDWPITEDINLLVRKSSGQFIYAATVVKFVRSPRRRPCEQLKIILGINATVNDTPFAELDALYYQIFSMVEDLPRALEVLSFLFLIEGLHDEDSSARLIKIILLYAPGDLQLILIDLHSVLHVPDMEDDHGALRTLHASLQDFLMDPARSGNLFIDQGKAHAEIAQHFLQYIRNYYSQDTNHRYDCGVMAFSSLAYHCFMSSAMRELLANFYDFDFRQWVVTMIQSYSVDLDLIQWSHYQIVCLYTWFKTQEANVQDQFGPGRSLHTHHSGSFSAAVDLIFKTICRHISDKYTENGENAFTAITHPHIVRHQRWIGSAFKTFTTFNTSFLGLLDIGIDVIEFQKYLSDPERAGRYFANGWMYATLSVLVFEFILDPIKW